MSFGNSFTSISAWLDFPLIACLRYWQPLDADVQVNFHDSFTIIEWMILVIEFSTNFIMPTLQYVSLKYFLVRQG
ncbi:hypothetical protein RchiOBHm_Chr5g0060361 [Rosa chinensis]|uniref:Uncharacterized protein n=1 Tax=Rosa chinensis TaxID=74649 RepID=A0A2P6QHN5_ROSCH|nr:hypothetical protein RchiOBHm_Chr5g0060361 [Rosa chinensis]